WTLIGVPDAEVPPRAEASLRMQVNRQPLDQEALNLLFAAEVRRGIDDDRRKAFASALSALGWRDNATQQNLLVEATRAENIGGAIARVDALLRRRKLVDNSMAVLSQLELYPQAVPLLIDRLAKNPAWRPEYFDRVAPLRS